MLCKSEEVLRLVHQSSSESGTKQWPESTDGEELADAAEMAQNNAAEVMHVLKPILRSLYTDRFADDPVSHYAVDDDLFEISLLCRRFLIPDDIVASANRAFESSSRNATLTCEKWLT